MSSTTPTPVLQSGTYYITSVSTGLKVSRTPAEDKSLLPKKVVTLPASEEASTWDVTKNRDGTYTLKNKGSPVVDINGKLFAQLTTPPGETRWKITSVYWQGADQWIVENLSRSDGWLVEYNDGTTPVKLHEQIAVAPLISTFSLPPQYPGNERFRFTRVRSTTG